MVWPKENDCFQERSSFMFLLLSFIYFKEHINRYFKALENIYEKGNISTRVKMLLLNLFELRGNNWCDRRRKEKPVTIDQIRSQKGKIVCALKKKKKPTPLLRTKLYKVF